MGLRWQWKAPFLVVWNKKHTKRLPFCLNPVHFAALFKRIRFKIFSILILKSIPISLCDYLLVGSDNFSTNLFVLHYCTNSISCTLHRLGKALSQACVYSNHWKHVAFTAFSTSSCGEIRHNFYYVTCTSTTKNIIHRYGSVLSLLSTLLYIPSSSTLLINLITELDVSF